MSMTPEEAAHDEYLVGLYNEYGPEWAAEHKAELQAEFYNEIVSEFTTERLKSYYVANPNLAGPASESLVYAQSLMPSFPKAALVFAATAMELAVKTVFLKPIVFGLVHTEGLATFITELTTQHTGMERFQTLLTAILAQFGGVDLRTYTRAGASKTLWEEICGVQKIRNAVVHRGESVEDSNAHLAISVARTLLHEIFPKVLEKLDLHLHQPNTICGKRHGTVLGVYFTVKNVEPSIMGTVVVEADDLDLDAMPETIAGKLGSAMTFDDVAAIRAEGEVSMWVTSTLVQYMIRVAPDSTAFEGTKIKMPKRGR